MIVLLNKDEGERAAAVEAVARQCVAADARLLVIGKKDPDQRLADGSEEPLRWVPEHVQRIPFDPDTTLGESLHEMFRSLRAALFPLATAPGSLVLWIECPLSRLADSDRLQAYERHLEQYIEPLGSTVISAFLVTGLGNPALPFAYGRRNLVITGSVLVNWSPGWIFERSSEEKVERTPAERPPPTLAQYMSSENLGESSLTIAGIAHELTNPLAVISSSLQYIHERLTAANDEARDFTEAALHSVERMHGMLQNMLSLATGESLSLGDVDLNDVVFEALRFVSDECRRRGVEVETSFDATALRGRFDATRVMQVILNLLLNAIEATPKQHGKLRVSTRVEDEGRRAVISVENRGPPISTDVRRNMFRPFFTTKASGTGLGLYLSRQNIKAHGGSIRVENLDSGVALTVVLPLRP